MIDTGKTNKYLHTPFEMFLMVIITAVSNGVMIPQIIYTYKIKNVHTLFLSGLLFVSSFMYHLSESIGVEPIILKEVDWHQLDNIASICGLMELFNYLMQNNRSTRKSIQWINFIFVVIIQESHAWNVWATVIPILISLIIFIIKQTFYPKKGQIVNKDYLHKGLFYLFIGFIAFYFGLDEYKDYLRLWHGLWHLAMNQAYFHLYQLFNPKVYTFLECWDLKQEYAKE
ncbi:unnamed protein product (macronuclear) [Paramecium tetraurelia]|uniref:Uncharacterized protein n=1 Tax=Paramecium tetraurelia TaxID=5888 RepID=A0CLA3_PARTE|nr:uncharacterized protein GSPATT00008117001 [Paramecium tetraurelia]CAK71570.1 unnamed protein product [Paramecium tetraurelia]|eukprot:XP_001438967.1 hypothetical protein (macronuclear) [Paramecium tetraurelia strain d4-2]